MNTPTKQAVISALYAWVNQRPGLEFGNYGDLKSYRAEIRSIGKDLEHARQLIRAVELRDSITAEQIIEASKHAYSGRLVIGTTRVCKECHRDPTLQHNHEPRVVIDYCTGQYWPTEYRRAVCAVMAACLWSYWRDGCMPPKYKTVRKDYGNGVQCNVDLYRTRTNRVLSAGDWLRDTARNEFGRSIASRWFN